MTLSPPGHEKYFEELAKVVACDSPPDAKVIGELRNRYDTDQLSALKTVFHIPQSGFGYFLDSSGRSEQSRS
jgi:hypothetical protein